MITHPCRRTETLDIRAEGRNIPSSDLIFRLVGGGRREHCQAEMLALGRRECDRSRRRAFEICALLRRGRALRRQRCSCVLQEREGLLLQGGGDRRGLRIRLLCVRLAVSLIHGAERGFRGFQRALER